MAGDAPLHSRAMLTATSPRWFGLVALALTGCFSPEGNTVPGGTDDTDGTTTTGPRPSTTDDAANSTGPGPADTSTTAAVDSSSVDSSSTGPERPSQVAEDDEYATRQDVALIIDAADGVLDNDVTVNTTTAQVVEASTPAGGNVTLSADGGFTYSPPAGYWGPDAFEYTLSSPDTPGETVSASVQLWVGPVSVDVGDITAPRGFAVEGSMPGEAFGRTMAAAGDVDGDGLGDLIASQAGAGPGGSVVILGGTEEPLLSTASAASWGIAMIGETPETPAGWSVAGAGDVNGDGRDDVIVSSVLFDDNRGRSYVVFGREAKGTVELGALGSAGFTIDGEVSGELSGADVAGAGDVNGDGLDDLLIGAIGFEELTGRTFVLFGKADADPVTLGSALPGYRIIGDQAGDRVGISVAGGGDLDGDRLDDVIIGAIGADGGSGEAYAVFGKASGANVNTANLGSFGFRLGDAPGDALGRSVAFAGDVNADGAADVIVGNGLGRAFVVFGGASMDLELTFLGNAGFEIGGGDDGLGFYVGGGHDVNGDGYADVIVGSTEGPSHVIYGKDDSAPVVATALDGTDGFTVTGSTGDVALVPDMNGDGVDDVALANASATANGRASAGRVHVLYGTPTTTN